MATGVRSAGSALFALHLVADLALLPGRAEELEFDSRGEAEAFKVVLEALWRSPQAAPALGDTPQARIVDTVETKVY